ncbi:putative beta-glucosidase 18-like [Capsicum annuum]|nr:putative beta-glucosidase 18-like [Capsicum annuum]
MLHGAKKYVEVAGYDDDACLSTPYFFQQIKATVFQTKSKSKNIIEENVVVKPSKNITVVVKPSKSITEEDVVEKPSKNIIEEEVVVKPSKSINQIDVNPAMEIYFPEEIIMDILIRLPVQSLLRFKCASKFWKTLISDPSSKAKHNNHAKKNKRILIAQQVPGAGKSFYFYSLSSLSAQPLQKLCFPSTHKPQRYVILCCCDGLCLLWSCSGAGHLLWNPSTNESVEFPDHEYPDATCSTYGLAFDSINDDYKILKIDNKGSLTSPNKIFALKSGCWRNIDNHPRGLVNGMRGDNSLAFVRGAVHWISKDNLSRHFMISLNISNEVYGEISLPEGICSRWICLKRGISVLQGMLCAYCTHESPRGGCTFKLWVMKDYGVKESWTELFGIGDPNLYFVVPKYWFADGEVLLYFSIYQNQELHQGFRTSD